MGAVGGAPITAGDDGDGANLAQEAVCISLSSQIPFELCPPATVQRSAPVFSSG